MDTSTLKTVVITAVITAMIKWLVSLGLNKVKDSKTMVTLSAAAKAWLIKEVFAIALDILALGFIIALAFHLFWNPNPLVKQDLLNALFVVLGFVLFSACLLIDIFRLGYRRVKEEEVATANAGKKGAQ